MFKLIPLILDISYTLLCRIETEDTNTEFEDYLQVIASLKSLFSNTLYTTLNLQPLVEELIDSIIDCSEGNEVDLLKHTFSALSENDDYFDHALIYYLQKLYEIDYPNIDTLDGLDYLSFFVETFSPQITRAPDTILETCSSRLNAIITEMTTKRIASESVYLSHRDIVYKLVDLFHPSGVNRADDIEAKMISFETQAQSHMDKCRSLAVNTGYSDAASSTQPQGPAVKRSRTIQEANIICYLPGNELLTDLFQSFGILRHTGFFVIDIDNTILLSNEEQKQVILRNYIRTFMLTILELQRRNIKVGIWSNSSRSRIFNVIHLLNSQVMQGYEKTVTFDFVLDKTHVEARQQKTFTNQVLHILQETLNEGEPEPFETFAQTHPLVMLDDRTEIISPRHHLHIQKLSTVDHATDTRLRDASVTVSLIFKSLQNRDDSFLPRSFLDVITPWWKEVDLKIENQ